MVVYINKQLINGNKIIEQFYITKLKDTNWF